MSNISCCGADCGACGLLGGLCAGCDAARGRVFHAPEGQACPIYRCCREDRGLAHCGACSELPCSTIMATRDPSLTEAAFLATVRERVARLRGGSGDGL